MIFARRCNNIIRATERGRAMKLIDKHLFRAFKLSLISLGILFCFTIQSHATSFSLVKSIDLIPLVGNPENFEVDVVGDELYVENSVNEKYYRIDPVTESLLGSFSLNGGIRLDNHGSEYNPTTGRIIHASDDDFGGIFGFDAFFETDTAGNLLNGPFDLFGPGDNTEDPEGLTVDPSTDRVWVSMHDYQGIFEVDPIDGSNPKNIYVGAAWNLGFNPITGKLLLSDDSSVIWEIATDGTGLGMVLNPGTSIHGMALTPTGDLALSAGTHLLLYDSDFDADGVFTTSTSAPVPEPSTMLLLGTGLIGLAGWGRKKFKKNVS
jgi:DNA-binding beta-propeller fold protein YncE